MPEQIGKLRGGQHGKDGCFMHQPDSAHNAFVLDALYSYIERPLVDAV
jgi:hypothetical protein